MKYGTIVVDGVLIGVAIGATRDTRDANLYDDLYSGVSCPACTGDWSCVSDKKAREALSGCPKHCGDVVDPVREINQLVKLGDVPDFQRDLAAAQAVPLPEQLAQMERPHRQRQELPPLPPVGGYGVRHEGHYSAQQMRDYAWAVLAAERSQ